MNVTVVTASLHGRKPLLDHCLASVPSELLHLVAIDNGAIGAQRKYNQLVAAAGTEWVAILDDDNYWLPNHCQVIDAALSTDAAVVYTWDAGGSRPRTNSNDFTREAILEELAWRNWIDQSCLVRRSSFLELGGFDPNVEVMDWDLWRRFAMAGLRFLCVPIETWVYRMPEDRQAALVGSATDKNPRS